MPRSATQSANSVCSLPRLRGRGGEGAPCTVYLCACPLPNPPAEVGYIRLRPIKRVAELGYTRVRPQAGEGTHRVRGAAVLSTGHKQTCHCKRCGVVRNQRAADSVCSLPRLRGRGGEGAPCTLYLCACPLPNPPPQAGEGTHRVRGAAFASSPTESSRDSLSDWERCRVVRNQRARQTRSAPSPACGGGVGRGYKNKTGDV
jgi:hypothetical protein